MALVVEKLDRIIEDLENYLYPKPQTATATTAPSSKGTKPHPSDPKTSASASSGAPAKASGKSKDAPAEEEEAGSEMSKCCFRVARIIEAKAHPDSEKLYIETLDLGEATPRTAVSGLAKHMPLSDLQNRLVVIITNLEPKKLAGVLSPCMVMAVSVPIPGTAEGEEGAKKLELLDPPAGAVVGERISVTGHEGTPLEIIKGKHVKKIFHKVLEDLKTDANRVGTYKGIPLMTSAGPCTCKSLSNGAIA